jgi:hypothetical protein
MSAKVLENRASFDLMAQFDQHTKTGAQNPLLPLHKLLPNKGDHSKGIILQFKRNQIKLSPCAKVQFFSDPDQVCLVHEFFAGNEVRTELAPLVLEYSRIWVHCYPGTNALVSHEEQQLLQ